MGSNIKTSNHTAVAGPFANTTAIVNRDLKPWYGSLESILIVCLFLCFDCQMSGETSISAFPEEDNIFLWKGTIKGSKDTVFENTDYKLSLSFPNDYPFKPPKVKFETTCFHPNVDLHGNICLDILQVM